MVARIFKRISNGLADPQIVRYTSVRDSDDHQRDEIEHEIYVTRVQGLVVELPLKVLCADPHLN